MNCRAYSLSKATSETIAHAVGHPLANSDQTTLTSDRSGE